MCYEFNKCIVSVCKRSCNKVADCLATFGARLEGASSHVFIDQAPDFVARLVSGDRPGGRC
uniref:Uncharacterized protein n=1 Tax=Arundo donax TaxID=35708 RepID=A0A0A9CGG1_ARUDO